MEKDVRFQRSGQSAAGVSGAIFGCIALTLALTGCAAPAPRPDIAPVSSAAGAAVYVARAPSPDERYCAWYGAQGRDDVLYAGEAAFWSAKASGGDPTGDLAHPGPQLVGRFDLANERWLPPLEVGVPDSRSGVWDVLMGEDGEVYFTTFFEAAGAVDPATGRVRRFALGGALNELGYGPEGTLLASRYGTGNADDGNGDLIAFDRAGQMRRRWTLAAPAGHRIAPKTPVWDDLRRELWITADQLPTGAQSATAKPRQDAIRIDARGRVHLLAEPPELLFVAKARDGTLYRAEADGSSLWLQIVPPPDAGEPRRVALDDAFAPDLDFAQDIQVAADGRVVVTRWSGVVHVVDRDDRVRSVALPRPDPTGLYDTGVLHGSRLCATYCADVTVVCVDAP